ncbi:recombinase family protein [Mailhella sp.]|uniref:recombinase family protein n=1 Tax=Mailhella sp. TaxID=1981029 RepID=UPI00406438DE
MRMAYKRVSTNDGSQNTERQFYKDDSFDKIFEDYASGKNMNRPALHEMINFCREGDEVSVWDLSRIGRTLKGVIEIISLLNGKGVSVRFVKENLTFTAGDDNPIAQLQLHILSAVYQFERTVLLSRQREGIQVAKAKGKYKGRKPTLSAEQRNLLLMKHKEGVRVSDLAREYGVTRATIYKYLAEKVA